MESLDRRAFIVRSGAVVAAAGAAVLVPAQLAGAVGRTASSSLGTDGPAPAAPPMIDFDQPIIAHVRSVADGDIAIFAGDKEYTVKDHQLASLLARATGGR